MRSIAMPTSFALAISAAILTMTVAGPLAATTPPYTPPPGTIGSNPSLAEKIDPLVTAQMSKDTLPGLTIAATRGGKLLFNKGYGFADLQTQKKMTADTRALIGSVTKAAITGPVGYQLMEAKNIDPATKTLYGVTGVFNNEFFNDIARGANRHTPIVELDIGQDDHTFAWYHDGTFSQGVTNDLDKYAARLPYSLPPYRKTVDIRGIAIAGNGKVYSWYDDVRTRSSDNPRLVRAIGTPSTLDLYSSGDPDDIGPGVEQYVSLPSGKTTFDIVGIAIAKSNDHVFVWYHDGTYSEGTSMDFDFYAAPKPFAVSNQSGGTPYDLRGLGIASNDRVYAWFGNGKASSGTGQKLDQYISPYIYSLPSGLAGDDWRTWYSKITIQNLLDHRAGFTRSGDTASAAEMFGVPATSLTYRQSHQYFLRTRPLIGKPGGAYLYSNHGFGLWTLLIEKISGKTYRDYAIDDYLIPMGVGTDIVPQGATGDARDATNYVLKNGVATSIPYEPSTLGLAAGGFRGTARALTVLTHNLKLKYGDNAQGDATLGRMGWAKQSSGRLLHNGALNGGMAYVVLYPDGYVTTDGVDLSNVHIAVVANRWGDLNGLLAMLDNVAKQLPAP